MSMAGVSTATGFAANVLSNVLSRLWNKVVEEVKMVVFLPRAVTQMKKEVQTLDDAIQDINAELDQEQRRPKRIVKTWLDTADELKKSSESIGNKYENYQQHNSCLGCCPRCLCRYRIGKSIRDWKRDVSELRSQRAQPEFPLVREYGDPTPRPQVLIQNPESGFVADSKRSAQMERVETWLADKDSKIRFVGLHGMGGVGKTLLLNTINDNPNVKKSFELIIKVTVSKNHILDLQDCVADRLSLKLPDRSNFEGRTERLRSYLKNKKFLLLLDDIWADDMWTSEELQNLGVSINDPGFKIVLTTRDIEACAMMNVQETIKVESLLEDEGWQLFRSRAFQNRNGNVPHEIEEVARQIAKECKGLPLAIIVVAAAMSHHNDLKEWEVALDQMRNVHETFYDLHPGVDKKLFQRLRWSYNVLPDYLQTCFLYFAAYPEDRVIQVEEVIDIWVEKVCSKTVERAICLTLGTLLSTT
jgi:disease resistance protein RPS2